MSGATSTHPPATLHQVWRGLALTLLVLTVGAVYGFVFLNFRARGVLQPFIAVSLILSIVIIFFYILLLGDLPVAQDAGSCEGISDPHYRRSAGWLGDIPASQFRFHLLSDRCHTVSHRSCSAVRTRRTSRGLQSFGSPRARAVGRRASVLPSGPWCPSGSWSTSTCGPLQSRP